MTAVALIALRSHAFTLPLETDECNYAYIGARLLEGDRLYEDVWDHQPPGVFVMFAGVTAVLGQSQMVFRWVAVSFSLASLALLYVIVRRNHGMFPAWLATAVFAVTSSDPGMAGEGCNREIYMNAFALGALAMLTRGNGLRDRHLLIAGLLLGLSSTFKTVIAAQWLFLLIWAIACRWKPDRRVRGIVQTVAWMSAGPILMWAGVFLYFAATGRWDVFIDAAFRFNISYAGLDEGFFDRYGGFLSQKFRVFDSAKPLWIVSAGAVPALLLLARRRLVKADGAYIAYALGSFQAVCLPRLYWPHYYYLLLPPMILLCAALIGSLKERVSSRTGLGIVTAVAITWVGSLLVYQYHYYLGLEPLQITAHRYDYRQQWARAQGYRVGELTDPDDTVFVWGKDAGIYYYSGRRCASRYTMVGALAEHVPGSRRRRQTLLQELESNRPRLVLLVEPEFDELRQFLQKNYVFAGLDMHDRNIDKPIMLALMDKDRPVASVDWEWRAPD